MPKLDLIDQSRPSALKFRCDNCNAEGTSNHSRAADNYLLDVQSDPPRWFLHECEPSEPPKKAKRSG